MTPVAYSRKRLRAAERSRHRTPHPQPSCLPSPTQTSPPLRKRPRQSNAAAAPRRGWTQLHLDVGQRDIAHTHCRDCGMVYVPGAHGDDALHRAFHAAATATTRLSVFAAPALRWTRADAALFAVPAASSHLPHGVRVYAVHMRADDDSGGVGQNTSAAVASRVRALEAVVRARLGEAECDTSGCAGRSDRGVVAVAAACGHVVGYARAERVCGVRSGRVRADGVVEADHRGAVGAWCGVRRVWVCESWRRHGVGTALVRVLQAEMGGEVAFSAPTEAGARFAVVVVHGRGREGLVPIYGGEVEKVGENKESDTREYGGRFSKRF